MLIRLGIPQSALVFIFIGRGSVLLFQVRLHKDCNNKTTPTRTRTGQTGLTGRPTGRPLGLPILPVNTGIPSSTEFQKLIQRTVRTSVNIYAYG